MRDVRALEEAIGWIEAHPEAHDQDVWGARNDSSNRQLLKVGECGTQGCLAGIGVCQQLPQGKLVFDAAALGTSVVQYRHGGQIVYGMIWEKAREVFGLSNDEADALFDGSNTLEDLKLMTKNLANGEFIYNGVLRNEE